METGQRANGKSEAVLVKITEILVWFKISTKIKTRKAHFTKDSDRGTSSKGYFVAAVQ